MKAIFIDIDGCFNHQYDKSRDWSQAERFGLANDLVANLRTVLDAVPDAKLVISSSWRTSDTQLDVNRGETPWRRELLFLLNRSREALLGDIPTLHEFGPAGVTGAKGRAHDILLWLSEHGDGDPFVVIDDGCKELRKWLGGHVVDCHADAPYGFTAERAQEAIRILQGPAVVHEQKPAGGCAGGC